MGQGKRNLVFIRQMWRHYSEPVSAQRCEVRGTSSVVEFRREGEKPIPEQRL